MLNLIGCPIDVSVKNLLARVTVWAEARDDISAVALVGSHAHGRARPDSDIDLLILSDDPDPLRNADWLGVFGQVQNSITEQWGILTAHRVRYAEHSEVEVGVAPSSWADIPVDAGTYRVASDGIVIVYDPRAILQRLITEVNAKESGST
jgi:predicted nucleotidyltransferase